MNLYERYAEWAGEKIAEHIILPMYSSEKLYNLGCKFNQRLETVNDIVATLTGFDYLENCRKEEEWANANPEKAALKRVVKRVGMSLLFGFYSDYKNLK